MPLTTSRRRTKHYQRLSDREAFVTAEMVRNAYQGIGTEYETLLRAFDKENEAFAKRVGKDRSKRTYQKYLTVRKYVAEFIKKHYKRTDMAMNELTEDFIRDYCLYLRNEVGLAQSSVWIYSIPLKHIVTTAHYNESSWTIPTLHWQETCSCSVVGRESRSRTSRT